MLNDGELVADRVQASGVRADIGAPMSWAENHIYRATNARYRRAVARRRSRPWLTAAPAVHRA